MSMPPLNYSEIERAYKDAASASGEPNVIVVPFSTMVEAGVPKRIIDRLRNGKPVSIEEIGPYMWNKLQRLLRKKAVSQ